MAIMATITVAAFQNCSNGITVFSGVGSSASKQDSYSGGNTGGYDGKPYVLNGPCLGSTIRKKVFLSASLRSVTVVRDECRDLPLPLPIQDIDETSYNPALPESLILNNQVLSAEALARNYIAVCNGTNNGQAPITLSLWRDQTAALWAEMTRGTGSSIERTQPRSLTANTNSFGDLNFESPDQYMNFPVIQGSLEPRNSSAGVAFIIPPNPDWNVERLNCTINP